MAVTLSRLSDRNRPQRAYKWRITIQGESDRLPPDLIQDCTLPIPAAENMAIHQGGTNDYYPNFVDIGNLSLTFIENDRGQVIKAINDWKHRVQRVDELFNYSPDYKRDVYCDLLTNGNDLHTRVVLVGVWPISSSPTILDYQSADIWRIAQEFSVDGSYIDR